MLNAKMALLRRRGCRILDAGPAKLEGSSGSSDRIGSKLFGLTYTAIHSTSI